MLVLTLASKKDFSSHRAELNSHLHHEKVSLTISHTIIIGKSALVLHRMNKVQTADQKAPYPQRILLGSPHPGNEQALRSMFGQKPVNH